MVGKARGVADLRQRCDPHHRTDVHADALLHEYLYISQFGLSYWWLLPYVMVSVSLDITSTHHIVVLVPEKSKHKTLPGQALYVLEILRRN